MGKARPDYDRIYLEGISKLLRRYKRTSSETSQQIANGLGVKKNTYDAWIEGRNRPLGQNLLALFDYYGADFVNDFILLRGFTGAYEVDVSEISVEVLHSAISRADYVITKAREDNYVDHNEEIEIRQELASLINHSVSYMAGNK